MGIYAIKPKFQQTLTPVKNLFVRYKVHPTIINILGFLCAVGAAILIAYSIENRLLLWGVPLLLFIRIALNALDGLVSRELGVASRFGEVLNEFLDRLSDIAVLASFYFVLVVPVELVFATVVVVLLVSYVGILGKAAGGTRRYDGLMGKADRMFVVGLAAGLVAITANIELWKYALWVIYAGAIYTVILRLMKIKAELA
jgi:CDP-diacylglycerol--glycerol-3-phosphate 3-phosphatidyltransferase